MRMLLAILLLLAAPAGALAGPHWNEGRGAPPPGYDGPGRPAEGDDQHHGYGGPPRGYQRPENGGPPRGYPRPEYGGPPRGYPRPEYEGPPRGYRAPPPYAAGPPPGPAYGEGPYGGPSYAAPSPRTQQQRARDDVRSGRRVPLPRVIEQLHRSTGAEYVDTREVRDPQGRPMYVLRFRQRGRYIDVPVDAETGMVQR